MSDFADGYLRTYRNIKIFGVVLSRVGDFMNPPSDGPSVWTNVPHLVTHHSPTGYEWGYAGSGPADLALNIMEVAVGELLGEKARFDGPRVQCWGGECSQVAWDLHHKFKEQFLARMPKEGGRIAWDEVVKFVEGSDGTN